MGTLNTYNTGTTVTSALNKGTISMAVNGSADLNTYDWCGACPVCNQYIIITDSYFLGKTSQADAGPACFCTDALTDNDLISSINRISLSKGDGSYSTLFGAMDYAQTSGFFIINQNYPEIVTSGCVLNMDASLPASYPMTGSSWYNLAVNNVYDGSIYRTLGDDPRYNSSGKGSITFNSANPDFVAFTPAVPAYNMPLGNEQYTISVWFNPSSLGNKGLVGWGNYGTTNEVNALGLSSAGLVNYWGSNDLSATTVITTGVWCNAVATFNGTTRSIWFNGVLIDSDTPTGHNVPYSNNLRIGEINTNQYFDGLMGDVQIFNRGLTNGEIVLNYNAFLTRYDGSDTEICVVIPNCTPTNTPTSTQTPTQTPTQTRTPTNTPTNTQTPTQTSTQTPTQTPTQTSTQTPTQTRTPTQTPTQTPSQTTTQTPTQTPTETPNQPPSQTPTPTPTMTPTSTENQTFCEIVVDDLYYVQPFQCEYDGFTIICNSPEPTPTPTPTPTSIPSANEIELRFNDVEVGICSVIPNTYYTSLGVLDTGTEIFTDASLIIPYGGGGNFVVGPIGTIYNLTGNLVGSGTGNFC